MKLLNGIQLGHYYAGDTQVNLTIKSYDKCDDIPSSIEDCVTDTSICVTTNELEINLDETELIVFSSKQHVKKTENLRITVGFSNI